MRQVSGGSNFLVFVYENKIPYNLKHGSKVKFLHRNCDNSLCAELTVHILRNPTNILSDGTFFISREVAVKLGFFGDNCKNPGIYAFQFQIIKLE